MARGGARRSTLTASLVAVIALAFSLMIALVTGSSGFIGSHLVDALLARGATVRVLVARRRGGRARRIRASTRWTVDLLDDRSVRESPAWDGVTHVFHLAGVTKRRTLAQFRNGNVVPTANLLAAAVARGGSAAAARRPRLVAGGGRAGRRRPIGRCARTIRRARSRRTARASSRRSRRRGRYEGQLPMTIVRPAAVYGPRDRDFLRAFRLAARSIAIHAVPRENRFSIVHVADLVDALLRAGDRPEAVGRTYFVANDAPVSWRELYDEIAAAASRAPALDLQLPLPAVAAAGYAGDIVSALTGWHTLANRHKTAARPSTLVALRSVACARRARLECADSPAARRARDVPLVPRGPVDAPTHAAAGPPYQPRSRRCESERPTAGRRARRGSRHARRTAGLSRGRDIRTTSSSASSAATASRTARSPFASCARARAPSPPHSREHAVAGRSRRAARAARASSTSRRSSAACTPASSRCPRIRPIRGAPIRACTASSPTRRRASRSCTRRSRRDSRAGSR